MRNEYLLLHCFRIIINIMSFLSVMFVTNISPSINFVAAPTLIYIASFIHMIILMSKLHKKYVGFILGIPSIFMGILAILFLLNVLNFIFLVLLMFLFLVEIILLVFAYPKSEQEFNGFLETSKEYHFFYYIFVSIGLGLIFNYTNKIIFYITLSSLILSALLYVYILFERSRKLNLQIYKKNVFFLPILLLLLGGSIYTFSLTFSVLISNDIVSLDIRFWYVVISIGLIIYPLLNLRILRKETFKTKTNKKS